MDCCPWRDAYERGPERGRRLGNVFSGGPFCGDCAESRSTRSARTQSISGDPMGAPRSIQSRYASWEISACIGAMGVAFGIRERLDRPLPDLSADEGTAPGNGSSVLMMSGELARLVPATVAQKMVPTRPAQRGNVRLGGRARRYYRVSITEKDPRRAFRDFRSSPALLRRASLPPRSSARSMLTCPHE